VTETATGGELLLDLKDIKAPSRPDRRPDALCLCGSQLSLSGFETWDQVSSLMAPYYAQAATLEPDSPLKAEADKIKAASPIRRSARPWP
jgi:hypothetical protein